MIRFVIHISLFLLSIVFGFGQIKTEDILLKNDSIELPGTLSYTEEGTPLVIWIHGSGNIDRNGNQLPYVKANYIKQIRDSLNLKHIAFFSFDKRTANAKNQKFLKNITINNFVSDINLIIDHFKKDKRFTKIVTIGHSQGSLLGMLTSKKVDKYISLAGPAESVDKTIIKQINKQSTVLAATAKAHFKELKETQNIKEINPMLISIFAPQNQSFMLSWMQYNPSEEIKKVKIPTLIINGTKDLQVSTNAAEELHQNCSNSKITLISNMNHVLKDIKNDKDNLRSYSDPSTPLSKVLIEKIVEFIHQ